MKAIKKFWNSYKFRFVPWIALNVKHQPRGKFEASVEQQHIPVDHVSPLEDARMSDSYLHEKLVDYFQKCHYPTRTNILKDLERTSNKNVQIMNDYFGFSIKRRKSTVSADAGKGVFVDSGFIKAGSLVGTDEII